ncbi:hypothetical protein [Halomonas sp. I5-271120]|uniref:hypothetical protein n=1 Tax=Halomonas sp. I5-271120 TaxID=3061632 RepID=UPI002714911E|nr:hypothetical protein [Halomonas sp. I5-271120]
MFSKKVKPLLNKPMIREVVGLLSILAVFVPGVVGNLYIEYFFWYYLSFVFLALSFGSLVLEIDADAKSSMCVFFMFAAAIILLVPIIA